MKKETWIWIGLFLFLIFTILITPVEARLFNQKLAWMYQINLTEYSLTAFALILGFFLGRRL